MKQKINFGKSKIEYSVIKSNRRKTSQITVDADAVIVRTPLTKKRSEIKKIVENKARWIYKKQLEFKKRTSGEYIPKKYTKRFLIRQVNFYASKIGVSPHQVVVKDLKSRWGSATKNNIVNLNVKLLKTPKKVIDYVILHELCHLVIRNHSYKFWRLVGKFMPQYENQKKWLDIHSDKIID